jgi:hypothetical protein
VAGDFRRGQARCYLVYALAPEALAAREANEALNAYIEDLGRGIPVFHDHFTGRPHGGFAVLFVETAEQYERFDDPGPLAGWDISVHPLVFALTPVGFVAQTEFTLEGYGKTSLAALRAAEEPDPRFWWRSRGE